MITGSLSHPLHQQLLGRLLRLLLPRYKPLKGVTSDMMVWLLNNDHKNVSFTGADGKVQNMPM
jgi:hypothetical protein